MPRQILLSILVSTALLASAPARGQSLLWQTLFDAGTQAQARGNLGEAEKQFAAALKNAGSQAEMLKAAGRLAYLYDVEGKFPEAQEQYQNVLQLDKKLHGPESLEVGADLNSLALVCQHSGKFNDAEQNFKAAIELFEKTNKKGELAGVLTNLALLMEERAKFELVEPLFKRALELYEKSGDEGAVAGVLDRYASFCKSESRYSEADALYTRALALTQQKFGESSPAVADSLCALAQLHVAQGDFARAETELKQALDIADSAGERKAQQADISIKLADCLRQEGKGTASRSLYQSALDLLQSTTGTGNARVGEAMRKLAQTYVDSGSYVQAEKLLLKALATDEQAFGALHPNLAVDLQTLALVYLDQGKYDKAESLYKKALTLCETVLGADHPSTATSLNNLAWLYYNLGKYEEAEPLVVRALTIRQKQFGTKHPLVAQNLSIYAEIMAAEKKYDQAEPLLLRAISMEEEVLGVEHPDISKNLKNLSVIYASTGRNKEAEETLRKLLSRDEKAYGEDSAAAASDLEALSAVLTRERNVTEAADLTKRARQIMGKLPGAISSSTPQPALIPSSGSASPSPAAANLGRPVRDKWAVVVGISNFKDPQINLRYAAKDATDFANYLVKDAHFAPDHVRLLTDSQATRENIVSTLGEKWLRRMANSDDLVCVFMSSHGSPARPEARATNYVVPYEGNVENIVLTGISMQSLTAGLKDLVHCDRMIVLLDVCHGGAALSNEKSLERSDAIDPSTIAVGDGQIVMVSSSASQTSWESKNYQNGVFTRRLIEGLKLKGDKTSMDDAFGYMKERVEEEVLRDRAAVQTPRMEKKWQGAEAYLGVPASAPRAGASLSSSGKGTGKAGH